MQKLRFFRTISFVLLLCFLAEIFTPIALLALTGGPVQVDFQGSPGSSEMVDPFTGEFSYNLPLLTVPGPHGSSYPVTLSYKSNFSPEDDASWVGLGWSLNPGAIVRNKNGFADDWKKGNVTYYNRIDSDTTYQYGANVGVEAFDAAVSVVPSLRFNNYNGWFFGVGLFSCISGVGNLGLNVDGEKGVSFSASVKPMQLLQKGLSPQGNGIAKFMNISGGTGPSWGKTWNLSEAVSRPAASFKYSGSMANYTLGVLLSKKLAIGQTSGVSHSRVFIHPEPTNSLPCYGYMYSGDASSDAIMDYTVEKEKEFLTEDNRFLSIPFSAPDDFIATGEGIRGKFRLHHGRVEAYRPNKQSNEITIRNSEAGVVVPDKGLAAGGMLGVSSTLENGKASLRTDNRNSVNPYWFYTMDSAGHDGEPYYFRFDNDMGGTKAYAYDDDKPVRAWAGSIFDGRLLSPVMNRGERHHRNTYIGYRTMQELGDAAYRGPYRAYNKIAEIRSMVNQQGAPLSSAVRPYEQDAFRNTIGELAIAGTNGQRYVYGLPVYSRNEYNLNFLVKNLNTVSKNFLVKDATADIADEKRQVTGTRQNFPYASTFLLTEVTTPDYYDVNSNGPDNEDIGGYTTFDYTRAYGSDNKLGSSQEPWYKWRLPYKGMFYSRNAFSDPRDDQATVSYGEKEVYYLNKIETKTHIAYFITNKTDIYVGEDNAIHLKGSGKNRLDAYGANPVETQAAAGEASYPSTSVENKMQYLEEIQLYVKDENGKPCKLLKKVRFAYNYSLMKGSALLNSAPDGQIVPSSNNEHRPGKLTLKYVWVEEEGVVNALTHPYEFVYAYPTVPYPAPYATYPGLTVTGLNESDQNPAYDPANIDCWGHYQKGGETRYNVYENWPNQNPPSGFDPAAWHLKVIKTPTEGEIHIQYEQNDYAYVQDRPAMAMVPLKTSSSDYRSVGDIITSRAKWYLDLDKAFGALTSDEKENLKSLIQKHFTVSASQREKIYFKLLYELEPLKSGSCNQEYIKGYASFLNCDEDGGGLYIEPGGPPLSGFLEKTQPIQAAYDFKSTHHQAMIDKDNCTVNSPLAGLGEGVMNVIIGMADAAIPFGNISKPVLYPAQSYVRIPIPRPKKGGGVRVKRLLFLNPNGALEAGDYALYGYEYFYEAYDKGVGANTDRRISSGVATNEPQVNRQENSLVHLIGEHDHQMQGGLVAGEKVIQYEGPLGESLLPAPSIGYSQVIVRALIPLNDVASSGFSQYSFYTAKEYPTIQMETTGINKIEDDGDPILEILQYSEESVKASQGYSFIRNQMHGVIAGTYNYGGIYHPGANNRGEAFAGAILTGSTSYDYYKPGEEVPVMYAPNRPLRMRSPGKQTEVVMESRNIVDLIDNKPWDYSAGVIGSFPFLIPSLFPYFFFKRDELDLHVTTKIVDCPVILKKTTSYQDGVTSIASNDVFDAVTGSPIVSHTVDGYDQLNLAESQNHNGSYHMFNIPAHMVYNDIGQRSKGEHFIFRNKGGQDKWTLPFISMNISATTSVTGRGNNQAGTCTFRYTNAVGASTNDLLAARSRLQHLLSTLSPGDLIELSKIETIKNTTASKNKGLYYLGKVEDKINTSVPEISFELFDPEHGSSPTSVAGNSVTEANQLEVIRSGRDNNLGQSVGSIAVYGKDINAAIKYARDLRKRESYAHRFNYWVYGEPLDEQRDLYSFVGASGLIHDSTISWIPLTGSSFDLVGSLNIPTEIITPSISVETDCETLPPYFYCAPSDNPLDGGLVVKSRFDLILQRSGTGGVQSITLGWWDQLERKWVIRPNSTTECKQDFQFTRTEYFGVNDNGDLVYSPYPYEDKYNDRNVNFAFRGENGAMATLSRVNAISTDLLSNALNAQAQVLEDNWPNTDTYTGPVNDYEVGKKGVWRSKSGFVFRTDAVQESGNDFVTTGVDHRTYTNAGTFVLPSLFNYQNPASNASGWTLLGAVVAYSATGIPTDTKNILGTTSATIYAHKNFVPAMTVYNATSAQITFESFEDKLTGVNTSVAHTGKQSKLISNGNSYASGSVTMTGMLEGRFWVRASNTDNEVVVKKASDIATGELGINVFKGATAVNPQHYSVSRIARTGEWVLYEVLVNATALAGSPSGLINLTFAVNGASTQYYVDDIRLKPRYSSAACYVYEKNTLRSLAALDENHFAMIYQYDAEGKPIRSIIETTRGYKTIAESIVHIPEKFPLATLEQPGQIVQMTTGKSGRGLQPYGNPSLGKGKDYINAKTPNAGDGKGGRMNILDINVSPDKRSINLFEQNIDSLKFESIKQPDAVIEKSQEQYQNSKQSLKTFEGNLQKKPDSVLINKLPYQQAIDSLKSHRSATSKKK